MQKVLLVFIAVFVLFSCPVQAANLNKYSNDSKIVSALNVLENVNANNVFSRLDKSATKIMFYDLSLIDYSYAKHFAVSSTDENGNNFILINERYKNSPKEAIASLIAHESVHVLPQATLAEETQATTTEAITWIKVRSGLAANPNDELVKRENKLALLYQESTPSNNLIKSLIAGNNFYQQQLAMK